MPTGLHAGSPRAEEQGWERQGYFLSFPGPLPAAGCLSPSHTTWVALWEEARDRGEPCPSGALSGHP